MMLQYSLKNLLGLGLFLSVLISSVSVYGEMKVVERSSKKLPKWVMQHPEEYLVAIATASTLQEAQSRVEQELIRKVMNAVAVNVEVETVLDSGVEEDKEWDNFYSHLSVRAAQLPFVSDISLAKCKDTYWEHSYDKVSKNDSFDIYVLYPFDSATRQKLIGEYEEYDSKMSNSLLRLEEGWKDVAEYEATLQAEGELEGLMDWFPDMQRRKRAQKTLELYRSIKTSLSLVGEIVAKGECRVMVMRDDRIFKLTGRLKASSNCASRINIRPDATGWTISYDTDDCLEYEENNLKLTLNSFGINLKALVDF